MIFHQENEGSIRLHELLSGKNFTCECIAEIRSLLIDDCDIVDKTNHVRIFEHPVRSHFDHHGDHIVLLFQSGFTPLFRAVLYRAPNKIINALLEHGASIECFIELLKQHNLECTQFPVRRGLAKLAEALILKHYFDVNAKIYSV